MSPVSEASVGAAGRGDQLQQRRLAGDGINAGLADGAVDGHAPAVVFLDVDADLRRLQIFGAELFGEILLQFARRFAGRGTSPTRGRLTVPASATCTLRDKSGTLKTAISSTSCGPIL